jgi:hypothetical protein
MNKPSLASLVAALTVLLVAAEASAAEDVPTTVLGLEALEGVPEAVAADITDALRQRVAGTKGYQLVQGKDLVEVKLVFSCPDEAPPCMSQAAKSMGATKVIFGNVKRTGSDYLVTLRLLDANKGTIESWTAETIPKKRAEQNMYRSLAPNWLATLSGKTAAGSLQVRANVTGATVSLDGTRVGVTDGDPVAIPDVTAGHHEVSVEKGGYTTAKQEFTLAGGQSLPLSLTLSPVSADVGGDRTEPMVVKRPSADEAGEGEPTTGSHTLSRAGFWVALVGTAAAAGLAVKFGYDVKQINSQLDPYRRFCTSTGCVDNRGQPAQPINAMTDPAGTLFIHNKTDEGNRDQTLQWVFVALAPPFALAAGYFFYKGYLESDSKEGTRTSSSHGLRIFPTATASAGGIIAEFDF